MLTYFVTRLKMHLHNDHPGSELIVDDCFHYVNALLIPRAYIHVDDKKLIHLVVIKASPDIQFDVNMPSGTLWTADVVWRFNPMSGEWHVMKDRNGDYENCGRVFLGGMPKHKP